MCPEDSQVRASSTMDAAAAAAATPLATTNQNESNTKFPFDIIVVTSPNSTAAKAASSGPLQEISNKFPHVQIVSTSDPYDVRCGSGGGTLAALHMADSAFLTWTEQQGKGSDDDSSPSTSTSTSPSVLIVHAGGQSSRCPTQMALGKAWTSLPFENETVGNPTFMLIESMGRLLQDAPQGTVAVAASDVLLSLEDEHHDTAKLDFTQLLVPNHENDENEEASSVHQNVVVGLAVPAPLETAQNHGVYVLQEEEDDDDKANQDNNNNDNNDLLLNVKIRQVSKFLQKPTVKEMKDTSSCTFDSAEHDNEESAWIDTGVVCFLPQAAQGLRSLANEKLQCCTQDGLQRLYKDYCETQEQQDDNDSKPIMTIEEFSKQTTLRIELYSHIMFALSTTTGGSRKTLQSYLDNQSTADDTLPTDILKSMFDILSNSQLKTCAIPTGAFVHLGTTKEMLDFMRHGASWKRLQKQKKYSASSRSSSGSIESEYEKESPLDITNSITSHRCQNFGRRIKMVPRSKSFLQLPSFDSVTIDYVEGGDQDNNTFKENNHGDSINRSGGSMRDILHQRSGDNDASSSSPRSARRTRSGSFLELSSNHTNGISQTRKRSGSFLETNLLVNGKRANKSKSSYFSNISPSRSGSIDSSCVVLNSILTIDHEAVADDNDDSKRTTKTSPPSSSTTTSSKIGYGSVVEHTTLTCSVGIHIGQHCLLSGVRGYSQQKIDIPNGMCLQMLPLLKQTTPEQGSATTSNSSMVYMYFGIHDDIKKCKTLYGMDVYYVLEQTGLTLFDLWDKDVLMKRKNSIWNARLHPVWKDTTTADGTSKFRHGELFTWITCLQRQSKDKALPAHAIESLKVWKDLPRLSLADIRDMADAVEEFKYRHELEVSVQMKKQHYTDNIRTILLDRHHEEIRFDVILDDIVAMSRSDAGADEFLLEVVNVMDNVIEVGIEQSQYDISSRTLMVMSLLLSDIAQMMDVTQEEQMLLDHVSHDYAIDHDIDHDIDILRASSSTTEARLDAFQKIKSYRNSLVFHGEKYQSSASSPPSYPRAWIKCASVLEKAGLAFISTCVTVSTSGCQKYTQRTLPPAPVDTWVIASAPARVDLAGGWSDTPPVSYEYGGTVTGIAVKVDGKNPLSARCRQVSGSRGIVLLTEGRDLDENLLSHTEVTLRTLGDLSDFQNPIAECALLKCALVFFELVPMDTIIIKEDENIDLQPYINKFCGSPRQDVGLEIVCTSRLPRGSGMGTSSILGGCILAAIGRCIGVFDAEKADDDYLIEAVLTLEQLLSTGGGWQDQVMGLVEGLKTGTSDAHAIPLKTGVNRIPIQENVQKELDERLILAYTGQTRLAKDILQNVLRRWARRSPDIVSTVQNLVSGATSAAQAVTEGDLDKLGDCINSYWTYKKIMAGEDSGVEPPVVKALLQELTKRNEIVGGSLCGAGGGGFMILLASAGTSGAEVERLAKSELNGVIPDLALFTWHECSVSDQGLTVTLDQ